jgi:hypothetical protein
MPDITNDSIPLPPPDGRFPLMGYHALSSEAQRAIECRVAQRILAWLASCEFPYYRDYITLVTEDAFNSKFMSDLAFGLYRHTDAASWLKWQDAPGSSSLLWQYAILRASQQLR